MWQLSIVLSKYPQSMLFLRDVMIDRMHVMKAAEVLKQGDCAMQALPAWPNVLSTGTRPQLVNGQPLTNGLASQATAEVPAQPKPGIACTSGLTPGSHVHTHSVTF